MQVYRGSFYFLAAASALAVTAELYGLAVWFGLMSLVAYGRGELWRIVP